MGYRPLSRNEEPLRLRRLRPASKSSALPLALAFCASMSTACASEAILSTDHLPVRRVIVYRNGVAYFERGGNVEGGEVRFKMKESEVGDFLATLAVMEHGGSSVRAAAFPLDREAPASSEAMAEEPGGGAKKEASPPLTPQDEADAADRKKGLRTVVLSLDGKEHDLQVGYVAESPVWRPSYRLVVHPDGTADLQAWGIVQNVSGEDWQHVHLTLVAGAPLAFRTNLGTSVIPTRPTVTDNGEVVAFVPHGDTSLNQAPEPPPPPAPPSAAPEDGRADIGGLEGKLQGAGGGGGATKAGPRPVGSEHMRLALRRGPAAAAAAPAPAFQDASKNIAPPASPVVPSGPRDIRSLAAVAAEGGSTRYDLPNEVTVPDKSATMVMLLSRPVPGEALFEYAPTGGVGDSDSHPFRVARFSNKTGGVLERGPIAVFEDGSFLGQGMVDPLPAGATATVPFALERSIAIDVERKYDELGARVAKIENGELTVERDDVRQTKYRVRNGGDKVAKVLVKHPRQNGDAPLLAAQGHGGQRRDGLRARAGERAAAYDGRARGRRADADAPARRLVLAARATRGEGVLRRPEDRRGPRREARRRVEAPRGDRREATTRSPRSSVGGDAAPVRRGDAEEPAGDREEPRRRRAPREAHAAPHRDGAGRSTSSRSRRSSSTSKLAELRVRFKEALRDVQLRRARPPPQPAERGRRASRAAARSRSSSVTRGVWRARSSGRTSCARRCAGATAQRGTHRGDGGVPRLRRGLRATRAPG